MATELTRPIGDLADISTVADYQAEQLATLREDYEKSLNTDKALLEQTSSIFGPESSILGNTNDDFIPASKNVYESAINIALDSITDLTSAYDKLNFALPAKPAIIDQLRNQRFKNHVYTDANFNDLEDVVANIYNSFQVGTSYTFNSQSVIEAINTAMYTDGYELNMNELENDINTIAAQWGADGYELAPGAMTYQISKHVSDFDRKDTQEKRQIFKGLVGIIQQNIQWGFENGISIEQIHMQFAWQYSEAIKTIIQAAVDSYIAEIQKRIDELQGYTQLFAEKLKVARLEYTADNKELELALSQHLARVGAAIQSNNEYMKGYTGFITEQIKLASAIADGYSGIFAALGAQFTGITIEQK